MHLTPRFATHHIANGSGTNAVLLGDLRVRESLFFTLLSDRYYRSVVQFRAALQRTTRAAVASLGLAIRHVRRVIAGNDVGGVAATRVVAGVQPQWLRPFAVFQKVRDAVDAAKGTVEAHQSIPLAIGAALPQPTGIGSGAAIDASPDIGTGILAMRHLLTSSTGRGIRRAGGVHSTARHLSMSPQVYAKAIDRIVPEIARRFL